MLTDQKKKSNSVPETSLLLFLCIRVQDRSSWNGEEGDSVDGEVQS